MIPIGLIVLLAGILSIPLPLPIGLPLALLGIALLVRFSADARRILVGLMRRYPPLRRLLGRDRKTQTDTPR